MSRLDWCSNPRLIYSECGIASSVTVNPLVIAALNYNELFRNQMFIFQKAHPMQANTLAPRVPQEVWTHVT
jgi:hypothetical protein